MTPFKSDFTLRQKCHIPIKGINPESPVIAKSFGEIPNIILDVDQNTVFLPLTDAFHVPETDVRLFSVKNAARNGWSTHFFAPPPDTEHELAGTITNIYDGTILPIFLVEEQYIIFTPQTGFAASYHTPVSAHLAHSVAFAGDIISYLSVPQGEKSAPPGEANLQPFSPERLNLDLAHLRNNHPDERRTRATLDAVDGGLSVPRGAKLTTKCPCEEGKMHHAPVGKSAEKPAPWPATHRTHSPKSSH